MNETTPFSTSWTFRLFHYDIIFAVINLKHMQDTGESGHPKYVKDEDIDEELIPPKGFIAKT